MVQIGWQVTYFLMASIKCFLTMGAGMNCRALNRKSRYMVDCSFSLQKINNNLFNWFLLPTRLYCTYKIKTTWKK